MGSPLTRLMYPPGTQQYQLFNALDRTVAPSAFMTTAEAKTHLRVTHSTEDTYIDALITAAVDYVEAATKRALLNQTWRLRLNAFPATDHIRLPRGKISSVTSVVSYDEDNDSSTFSTDYYSLIGDEVVLGDGYTWPTDLRSRGAVEVTFVAGYGSAKSSVPSVLVQAVYMLVGHYYENREAVTTGTISSEIKQGVAASLQPYVVRGL